MSSDVKLDEVGYWTEIKLQIIRDYSAVYAKILKKQAAMPTSTVSLVQGRTSRRLLGMRSRGAR